MTIEQKAREIVASILRQIDFQKRAKETEEGAWDATAPVIAARIGIIEGRRQAFEEAAKVAEASVTPIDDMCCKAMARNIATAIRALVEEQKL